MSYEPSGFSRNFGNKYENTSSRLHSSVSNGEKSAVNGVVGSFGRHDEINERRNYKLLIDPAIKKGHQKIYRFDGVFPGQPPVVPKDPRSRRTRIWKQIKAELPVPSFKVYETPVIVKVDKNYVGIPPQREVLFTGLNDNVDKKFLQEMCERYGKIENIKIYYDAVTKKHSGKGRVTLSTTSAAKMVMSKLDSTSVMGNIIRATLEPNLKGLKNVTKQHRGEHTFVRRGSNEDESIAPGRRAPAVASKFLTHLPTPSCSMNSQSPSTESSVSTPSLLVDPRLDNLSALKPPPPPPPRMTDVSPDCANLWDKTSLSLKLSQSSSFMSPQSMMSSSASFEPISPPPAPLRTKDPPPPPPPGKPPSPQEEASIACQQSHDKAHSGSSYMNFEDISPDPLFSPEENSKLGRQEHPTHQVKTETKAASKDKSDNGNINRLIESCRRNASRSSLSVDNKGRSPKSEGSWSRERKLYSERDDRRDRYRDKERSSDGWDQERSERDHGYSPRERRSDKHSDFKGGNRHRNYRWNERRDDRREEYKKYDKRHDYDRNRQHWRDRYSTSPRQGEDRRRSESSESSHRDKVNDSKNKEQEIESRNSHHLYQDASEHVMSMSQVVKTEKEPEAHRASKNESTITAEASLPLDSGSLYTVTQTMQNHSGGNSSSSESSSKVTNAAEIISLVVSGDPQAETKVTGLYDGDAYTVGIEACSDEEPLPPGDEEDVADKVNKERSRNKLKAAQDNIKKRKYSTETGEEKQENSVKAKKQIQIVVKSRQLSATAEPGLSSSGNLETTCKDDYHGDDDCSNHFRGGWRTVSLDQPCDLESNNLPDETSDQEGFDMAGDLPVVEDISPCPSPTSVQMTECMVTTIEAVVKTSEEPASTQLYSDIEGNEDSGGNADNDDAMSLSSISSNEETFQVNEPVKKMSPRRKQIPVTVPPPRIPFPPYPPPPPSFNLGVLPPAPFNPMVPPPLFRPVAVPPPPLHPVGVPPPALLPPSSLPRVPPPSIPPPSVPPITVPPPPIHPVNVPPPPIHPSVVPHMTIPPPIVPPPMSAVPPPIGPPHIPPPPMRNPGFYDGVSMSHYPKHGSKYQDTPPPPPPKKTWRGIMTDEVYSAVSSELVKMVNRDVFRKLIETSAFKALEAWWDNQTKPKESLSQLPTATPGTHPAPSTVGQPSNMSSTRTMLGPSPFERQHSMVIGIKASLPKLPSFKVKRTLQPPKYEELDTSSHKQGLADSPVPHERANKRRCLDDGEVDTDLEGSRGTEQRQRTTSRMEEEERSESPWQHLDDCMDVAPPATRVRSNRDIVEAGRRTSTGSSLYHKVYSSSEGSEGEEESESAVSESGESEAEGSAAESGEDEEESEAETEEESDEESDEEMKGEEPALTRKEDEKDEGGSFTRNLSSASISLRWTEGIQRTVETVTLSERTNYQTQRAAAMDDVANAARFARPVPRAEVTTMVDVREQETNITKERTDTVETISGGDTESRSMEKEAAQNSSKLVELVRSSDTTYSPPRITVQVETVGVDRGSASEDAEFETTSDNDEVFIGRSTSDLPRSIFRALSLVELDHPYGMSASEDEPAPSVYQEEPTTPQQQHEPSVKTEWEDTTLCQVGRKSPIIDVENGVAEPLLLPLKPEEIIPPEPIVVKPSFLPRRYEEDDELVYEMIRSGIDNEDARYLKIGFERLLQVGSESVLDAHWGYHPACPQSNVISWKRRKQRLEHGVRVHATGCARTEGYYKLNMNEKARYLETARRQLQVQENLPDEQQKIDSSKAKQQSREHRLVQRRLQSAVIKEDYGDLLKFNQLRVRKKQLKFAKSGIHDWGLFALEPIAADEMVIEYVGEVIRQPVADLRERRYEDMGIGSSYMFRVDQETIIDATTLGNLARFINHCCDPNCYARIISVENDKKIVIYSKRDIQVNEEITYDYKFPIEDEKIACLCGVPQCRGTLN